MKVSNCCGVRPFSKDGFDTEDIGICPKCKEHCEYLEYCDECGEEIKDCICDIENPAGTGLNDITTNKKQNYGN